MADVQVTPPPGAVKFLRANPQYAPAFDNKYGPGLSAQFLGEQADVTGTVDTAAATTQAVDQTSATPQTDQEKQDNFVPVPEVSDPTQANGLLNDVGELASAAWRGAAQAVEATGDVVSDAADAIGLPAGVKIDSDGISLLSQDEMNAEGGDVFFGETGKKDNALTETVEEMTGPFDNVAAGAIEGLSQFATSFAGVGSMTKGLGALQSAGKGATAAKAFVADFMGFNKEDQFGIGNLFQSVGMDSPLAEWFAVDEDDSEWEARAVGALTGLGLGAAADGVFSLLKHFKKAKQVAQATKTDDEAQEAVAQYASEHADELQKLADELGGTVDGDVVKIQGATVKPKQAPGAPQKPVQKQVDTTAPNTPEPGIPSPAATKVTQRGFIEAGSEVADRIVLRKSGGEFDVDVSNVPGLRLINYDRVDVEDGIKESMEAVADLMEKPLSKYIALGRETHADVMKDTAEYLARTNDTDATKILADLEAGAAGARETAKKLVAARTIQAKAMSDMDEIATKVFAGTATEADKIQLNNLAVLYSEVATFGKAIQTSTARALSAGRIVAKASDGTAIDPNILREGLESQGGQRTIEDIATIVKAAKGNPQRAGKALTRLNRARVDNSVMGQLAGYYLSSLLSSPITQIRNILGNSLQTVLVPMELYVGGVGNKQMRQAAVDHLQGTILGAGDAVKAMAMSFRTGRNILDAAGTPFETKHNPLGGGYAGESNIGHAWDWTRRWVIGMPGRGLMAGDELFKQLNYRGSVRAQIMPEARQRFPKATQAKERAEWVAQQMEKMFYAGSGQGLNKKGIDYAREATFTNNLEFGTLGYGVQQWVSNNAYPKFFIPFVRTPVRLLEQAVTRTPGAQFLNSKFRQQLAAGGEEAARARGKIATASTLLAATSGLVMGEKITGGGPRDPNLRKVWLENNQPYSFVSTDENGNKKFTPYKSIEPIGTVMGLIADIYEISGSAAETGGFDPQAAITTMILSVANSLESKSYLRSIVETIEVLFTESEWKAERYLNNLASNMVVWNGFRAGANLVSDAAGLDIRDPYMREVHSVVDAIKAKVPGLSQDLALKRSWLTGEPIQYYDTKGLPPELWPFAGRTVDTKTDASFVTNELSNLGYPFRQPPRLFGDVELTPEQYSRYVELTTKPRGYPTLVEALKDVMQSSAYDIDRKHFDDVPAEMKRQSDESPRVRLLRKVISKYRSRAKKLLMREDRQLGDKVYAEKRQSAQLKRGQLTAADQANSAFEALK